MKTVKINDHILLHPRQAFLRKAERFADPRILQIELVADWVITKDHPDKSIHSDRVMPLKAAKKFVSILRRKTKTFRGMDDSHFWVSGYYALHFYLKSSKDRAKMKRLVTEAVNESGGFMSFDYWYEQHNKKHSRVMQYNGTGSGITQTYSNLTDYVAFL